MTTKELAKRLRRKPQTIRLWRTNGIGPRYYKPVANRVLYRRTDVEQWLKDSEVESFDEEVPDARS